ncbi:MAG: hypothetical protein SA339_10780 [Methanomassiliicoccus sp.]|nr:hypothetical protein [Methanomassiliicoccus sp.]
MDRSSGLKECPRCGLRNRHGAYQCDFCGWDFKAASDDWMGQVNDLERIGRDVEVSNIDSSLRSRIELTMKKPSDMPVTERKPEAGLEVPPHLSLEDGGDVMAQPTTEVMVETGAESTAPPAIQEIVSVPLPEDVASPESATEPTASAVVREESIVTPMPQRRVTSMPQFVPGGLLTMGLGVYALDIYVISAGILTGGLAWGVSALASILMVYAVIRYLPMITKGKRKNEDEAILCPVCHEMVSDHDSKCPSCGVRFRDTPSRE